MGNKKKIIRWSLFISWMILIFTMSQMPGDESTAQSDLVVKIFDLIGIKLDAYFGELATFIVRKTAHFSEYFILFILTYRVMILYFDKRKAKLYSVIFVFFYASSDEIHQYFVEGRTAAFRDVLIDTSGGITAAIVTKIIEKLKKIDKIKGIYEN